MISRQQVAANVRRALKTLRRIPDDVILAMGTVEYTMGAGAYCVVGWAVRQDLLAATGEKENENYANPYQAQVRFGGTYEEWRDIFSGVCYDQRYDYQAPTDLCLPEIELAFVRRIDEAVRRA